MSWKVLAALVLALAWQPSHPARAAEPDDESATEENAEPESSAKSESAKADEESGDEGESSGDEDAYIRDGWYVGLGGGGSIATFDGGSAGDSGFAQLRAGYHFLRFASIEPQIEYTPKFKGQSGHFDGANVATWALWANFKGYPTAPWTGRFQPFGMIGIAWMWERITGPAVNGSVEKGAFAARFGAGFDVYITDHWFLTAEGAWVLPTSSLSALNQIQIGGALQYRF